MSGPCDLCTTHYASHIYNDGGGRGDEDICQCCWNTYLGDDLERTEYDPDCAKPCTYCGDMSGRSVSELWEVEKAIGWPVADGKEPTEEGRQFCRDYGHAADYSSAPSPICMRCGGLRDTPEGTTRV